MTATTRPGLERYRDLFLWMLIPMSVMQVGIFPDYWGDLTDNAWAVHVHYWTASLWYLFLILQPYLAARGQFERHRTYGMIGFFLAGGVAFTALSALYRDVANADRSAQMPDQFGPFEPGSGNFTKVVQRIGVRIRLDRGQESGAQLRPGLSVTANVMLR